MLSLFYFVLLSMTLQRALNFFLLKESLVTTNYVSKLIVYGQGLRFDLLILGFIMMPSYILIMSLDLGPIRERLMKRQLDPEKIAARVLLYYSSLFLILNAILSWIDTCFFQRNLRHLRWFDFTQSGLSILWTAVSDYFQTNDLTTAWLMSLVSLAFLIYFLAQMKLSLVSLRKQKIIFLNRYLSERIFPKKWMQILASVLLVLTMARGTWTAHHLELRHSQIFREQTLNELILNMAWTINKDESTLVVN